MMARLPPEIKVPQQTLSAINPCEGGARASPEPENSNFTRQIKQKTGAKESSGADFFSCAFYWHFIFEFDIFL